MKNTSGNFICVSMIDQGEFNKYFINGRIFKIAQPEKDELLLNLIKNKVLAGKNSNSKLSGTAKINKDCENCKSDIAFLAMVEQDAKIEFLPAQIISSETLFSFFSFHICSLQV